VVELDLTIPFTAARARNEGFARLLELTPGVRYVQFVDGDCELVEGWLERAAGFLERESQFAVVCGRRRERFPDHSVYNRLADIEWDTPIGETKASGGDALMRVDVFQSVNGFNPAIIAAEDDDVCLRIRQKGWKIMRLDAEMTLHDMAMTRFGQWWRRSVRTGHAYAEGVARHGRPPERHFVRQLRSAYFWGLVVPVLALGLAWPTRGLSLLLFLGYAVTFERIRRKSLSRGLPATDSRIFARTCVIAKFAHVVGAIRFKLRQLTGRRSTLIEYK
jgi:cellulose synthase/poly-beta-1,6-N-acetylglucosamine synthase-like glycosyltransferase